MTESDGETVEAGGFCNFVDDDLEVRLPMRHEGTVVSKQCFQDSLFHSLCLGCQSAKVEKGAVKPISSVHSLFKVPEGMVLHAGEEQVEEDGSQHTPLLDAVEDAESICPVMSS